VRREASACIAALSATAPPRSARTAGRSRLTELDDHRHAGRAPGVDAYWFLDRYDGEDGS
jgi:hypothetical protein